MSYKKLLFFNQTLEKVLIFFLNDVYSSLNILFLIAFIQPSLLLLAGALRKPNSMVLKVKMPEVKKIFKVP